MDSDSTAFHQRTGAKDRRQKCARLPRVVYGLALMLACTVNASALQYEVKGRLYVRYPSEIAFAGADIAYDFVAAVQDCKWWIDLKPITWGKLEPNEVIPDYIQAGSDGTNFYVVTSTETFAARVGTNYHAHSAVAVRGPGAMPFAAGDEIIALYYAFASECYFRQITNGLLFDLQNRMPEQGLQSDIRCKASWRLEETAPRLPRWIGMLGAAAIKQGSEIVTAEVTNSVFSTLAFTNAAGLLLPARSEVRFQSRVKPDDEQPTIWREFVIIVSSAVRSCSVKFFVPSLPSGAWVQDIRFRDRSPPAHVSVKTHAPGWPTAAQMKQHYQTK